MRAAFVAALCLWVAGATARAEPLSGELDALLQRPGCETPVSVQMPKAPLSKLFDVLGRLSCKLRFEVPADVAAQEASIQLRGARLSTVLDVLAGNHDLVYVVEDGIVRVRRKPTGGGKPAAGIVKTSVAGPSLVGATAARRSVRFRLAVGRPGALVPAANLRVGTTSSDVECTMVWRILPGGRPPLRLHADGTVKPEERGDAGTSVRLCAETVSESGVDIVGEAIARQVFDDGNRTIEERTIFRRSLRPGDKDVSLYKTPQAEYELMLVGWELEPPVAP